MNTMNITRIRKISLGVLIAAGALFLGDKAFDIIDLPDFLETLFGIIAAGSAVVFGCTFFRKEKA